MDKHELKLDALEGVTGGTSPILPGNGMASLGGVSDLMENDTDDSGSMVIAYCRACGKQLAYLGSKRIEGGVTGKFKCLDPACAEFDKIKYNDAVSII